jgi:hypothetical protein
MAAFYLDNDVNVVLAELLRSRGHTALTARDLALQRAPDADHLLLAAQRGWIMVTRNVGHFRVLHEAWRLWSTAWNISITHAGILVIPHGRLQEMALHIAGITQMNLSLDNQLYEWR